MAPAVEPSLPQSSEVVEALLTTLWPGYLVAVEPVEPLQADAPVLTLAAPFSVQALAIQCQLVLPQG